MRQRLVEFARQAFERDGYDAVSYRELAKTTGVSTGAFYSLWESKADLFSAAMDHPAPQAAAFASDVVSACDRWSVTPPSVEELKELGAQAAILRSHLIGNGCW